jgi:hypothetical protein
VVSKGQQQYVKLAFDEDTEAYDLVVDDSPTAPNQRERAWQMLQPILMQLLASQLPIPMEFYAAALRASPLPSSLIEELITAFEPDDPSPEEQQQAEEQRRLVLEQIVSGIDKTRSDALKNRTAAALNSARAQDLGFRGILDAATLATEAEQHDQDREADMAGQLLSQGMASMERAEDRQAADRQSQRTERT